MHKRVTQNPITSLAGLIIIIGCLVLVALNRINWDMALTGIGMGLTLLMMKDPRKPGGLTVVVLLILVLNGCRSRKPEVRESMQVNDSSFVSESYTPMEVSEPEVWTEDEVILDVQPGKKESKSISTKGRARGETTIKRDAQGKPVSVKTKCTCDSLRKVVYAKEREITRIRKEYKEKPPVMVRYTAWYDKWARWIALGAILYFGIKLSKLKI